MKTRQLASLLALVLCTGTAWSQKLVPGLWENTTTMKQLGQEGDERMAKMQEKMAKMPPEQRKMMEEMMAKRGVSGGDPMAMMAGKPTTLRVCVTPAQAARDFAPMQEGRCKSGSIERSGKTVRVKFSCSGDTPSTGVSEYTMTSDRSYSGRMQIDSMRNGKPARMEMTQAGRWLGADCGDVKPMPSAADPNAGASTAPGAKP